MKSFHEIQYRLRNPRIQQRTFDYDLEATLISATVHVRQRQRVSMGLMMSAADITNLKASYRNYRSVNRHWIS